MRFPSLPSNRVPNQLTSCSPSALQRNEIITLKAGDTLSRHIDSAGDGRSRVKELYIRGLPNRLFLLPPLPFCVHNSCNHLSLGDWETLFSNPTWMLLTYNPNVANSAEIGAIRTEIGIKAWLFAKLQPGRARKRINTP